MKRSVFYDGVEIYSEHLNYIEESKAEAIKNIVLTFGICGPVKGLVVAPDPNDAYKVMITAGVGYTYGGEYYELTSNVAGVAISNVIGAKNYVCVKVTEVDEYPLPNVISGEVKYTRKNQRYDVLVLGETGWQNLADKSMYSLLAIVYGSGGFVRGSDIKRAVVVPASLLFVEQQPVVIRGVKVVTVSNNTPLGTGTLRYRYDNVEQKSYLKWKAPNGIDFGAEVKIGSDGVYKIWDQLGVSYLQVEVSVADLLTENVNEDLQVIDMLEQRELNTGTMIDVLHRSMMGGGMPSVRNPHGQTLDDFEPGEVQNIILHQSRFHRAGIMGEPGTHTLKPTLFNNSSVFLNSVIAGEYVVSRGYVFDDVRPLYVRFDGKVAGVYTIYVDDKGSVAVSGVGESVDSKQFCVIARVTWNGSVLSNLVDLREFGTMDTFMVKKLDNNYVLDIAFNSKSLADDIARLRYMIKVIIGENKWDLLPVLSFRKIVDEGFTTKRLTVTDELSVNSPPIRDENVVRVKDLRSELEGLLTEGKADLLYVKSSGDTMGGKLYLVYTADTDPDNTAVEKRYVDNLVPLYPHSDIAYVDGGGDRVGISLVMKARDVISGQRTEYFIPASLSPCLCLCTCTCQCTCTCTCTCTCRCRSKCNCWD